MSLDLGGKLFKSISLKTRVGTPNVSYGGRKFAWRMPKVAVSPHDPYIVSLSSFLMSYNQLEACRKVVTRIVKKQKPKAKFKPCIRFTFPFTSKSKNSRMGRGKGNVSGYKAHPNVPTPIIRISNTRLPCAVRSAQQMETKSPITSGVLLIRKEQKHD